MLKANVRPQVDAIYACLPEISLKGVAYDISSDLRDHIQKCGVGILDCQDEGPITKILPVLDIETEPETVLITIDDDMGIESSLVGVYKTKCRAYPNAAFSLSGWICGSPIWLYLELVAYPWVDTVVDVIEGSGVNCFRRKHLDPRRLRELLAANVWGQRHDDHILGAQLSDLGIPKLVISADKFRLTSWRQGVANGGLSTNSGFFGESFSIMDTLVKKGYYGRGDSNLGTSWPPKIILSCTFFVLSCMLLVITDKTGLGIAFLLLAAILTMDCLGSAWGFAHTMNR